MNIMKIQKVYDDGHIMTGMMITNMTIMTMSMIKKITKKKYNSITMTMTLTIAIMMTMIIIWLFIFIKFTMMMMILMMTRILMTALMMKIM